MKTLLKEYYQIKKQIINNGMYGELPLQSSDENLVGKKLLESLQLDCYEIERLLKNDSLSLSEVACYLHEYLVYLESDNEEQIELLELYELIGDEGCTVIVSDCYDANYNKIKKIKKLLGAK